MSSTGQSLRYRTIVADPPWPHEEFVSLWPATSEWNPDGVRRAGESALRRLPYPSMSVSHIADLPIRDLAEMEGACLFLWTTTRFLPLAFRVVKRWGFEYRQTLVWDKTNGAPWAGSVAPNAEFILVGRRGKVEMGRLPSAVFRAPRVKTSGSNYSQADHSVKPELFLDWIESITPEPRIELFARRQRLGWDTWGNQALEHVEMAS